MASRTFSAASVSPSASFSSKAGFRPEFGVEARLLEEARARDLEVRELESFLEQMKLFAELPQEAQVAFLRDGLDELANLQAFFDELKTAWLEGELETIDKMLTEGLEASPELAERLLYQRNRNWLPEIETLLEEPGTHIVAVGAGHLIGSESLIALLRDEGYEVARQE